VPWNILFIREYGLSPVPLCKVEIINQRLWQFSTAIDNERAKQIMDKFNLMEMAQHLRTENEKSP